ncbi:DNA mismatch repair protein Mlh3-like isoform X2 [Colias croceus]|uniref:DNA mismatch repair protein Mlh3-like isoform X2 n=1 Tax=Colias crocea TaxID=72248 RepID=UPI001E27F28C|nr:DNA mismatch repair protein Mlh3-like isoform X2 [Colias croceus]
MIKIPTDVQSVINAAYHINSFSGAVEELVYNSLDADSTSIAIRVDIQESLIQVIDNGCGIKENDFNLLGQKYSSSKFVDIFGLKTIPCTYGYCGLSLATIIDVCHEIKIISRHQDSQETWMKIFCRRECKELTKTTSRPSKGTTVDIKGFLYNLKIQRKAIETHNEMLAIKTLLEHLSLVHVNVSFSLRDDGKNEIVFQIHKNRDLCSTISSLFNILPSELQELQIEKKYYKVKALIGKGNMDFKKYQWIFLNRKFIFSSKIHQIMNKHLKKSLCIQQFKPIKKLHFNNDETYNHDLPLYFLFISCPYFDYDVNYNLRKTTVEFKNWDQITNILQKLAQCYCGEIKLKEVTNQFVKNNTRDPNFTKNNENNTREEVKKIVNKILMNPMKQKVLDIHNGVKGLNIKRQRKQNKRKLLKSKQEFKTTCNNAIPLSQNEEKINKKFTNLHEKENRITIHHSNRKNIKQNLNNLDKKCNDEPEIAETILNNDNASSSDSKEDNTKPQKPRKRKKVSINCNYYKNKRHALTKMSLEENNKNNNQNYLDSANNKKNNIEENAKCFQENNAMKKILHPPERLKEKHKLFPRSSRKVQLNKKPRIKENFNFNINDCKLNATKNKPIDYKIGLYNKDVKIDAEKFKENAVISSYDLVQTILKDETKNIGKFDLQYDVNANMQPHTFTFPAEQLPESTFSNIISTKLTYESHKNYNLNNKIYENKYSNLHYISKASKDLFSLKSRTPFNLKNITFKKKNCNKFNKASFFNTLKMDINESVYTIQVSNSINNFNYELNHEYNNANNLYVDRNNESIEIPFIEEMKSMYDKTYTIENYYSQGSHDLNKNMSLKYDITYSIQLSKNIIYTPNENFDIINNDFMERSLIFNSNYMDDLIRNKEDNKTFNNETDEEIISILNSKRDEENVDPLNFCETIIDSIAANHEPKLDNHIITNDSLFDVALNLQDNKKQENELANVTSHHFNSLHTEEINELFRDTFDLDISKKQNTNIITEVRESSKILEDFTIQGRHTFMPKGMSPIIKNINKKMLKMCSTLEDEYYEDRLYKKFAESVVETAKVFEPKIQNVNEIKTTRDINKFNNKIIKDKADLVFDAKSLKQAKVFGQVDCKFIATITHGKIASSDTYSDFLVLFDQHAVHERIRLEKNLSDYFDGTTWKSVTIDGISLKLPKDDAIFLHNYKDKLSAFGLQWTLTDNIITLYGIPKAIFGHIDRQEEVVFGATKNLLAELIDALKYLKGNIPLYPQTIMNLVFSEACRYAIMFGDKLSKQNCVELLESLARCKTPFQCAHGRPVMAVLMEMNGYLPKYNICFEKIKLFKSSKKKG